MRACAVSILVLIAASVVLGDDELSIKLEVAQSAIYQNDWQIVRLSVANGTKHKVNLEPSLPREYCVPSFEVRSPDGVSSTAIVTRMRSGSPLGIASIEASKTAFLIVVIGIRRVKGGYRPLFDTPGAWEIVVTLDGKDHTSSSIEFTVKDSKIPWQTPGSFASDYDLGRMVENPLDIPMNLHARDVRKRLVASLPKDSITQRMACIAEITSLCAGDPEANDAEWRDERSRHPEIVSDYVSTRLVASYAEYYPKAAIREAARMTHKTVDVELLEARMKERLKKGQAVRNP